MRLLLKNADGECVSVTVFQTDTFSDLKSRIAVEDNIDIDIEDFSIEGRPIKNDLNVVQYFKLNVESEVEQEQETSFNEMQMCRLCAENFENNKLLDVFEVIDKVTECLPIQIQKDDKLSKFVCIDCSKKLDDTKNFIDSCLNAEKKQLMHLSRELKKVNTKNCSICSLKDLNDISFLSTFDFFEAFEYHNKECLKSIDSHPNSKVSKKLSELFAKDKVQEVNVLQTYCPVCQKKVGLVSYLKALCHGEKKFGCFLCRCIKDSIGELFDHLKEHFIEIIAIEDSQLNWRCTKCEIVSNDGNLFEKHFKNHTLYSTDSKVETEEEKKKIYRCHLCSKSFRCKNRLEFHLEFHIRGAKAGQCSECRREFTTELCLYKHMLYNHLDRKVFTCEHCGKTFRNKSSLTYHFRSHSSLEAMKPFTCEVCKKRFARKNILRDHMMNRHGSGIEPQPRTCFQCHVCKEVFPNTDSAISHMEIHHPENVDEKVGYSFDMLTLSKLFICEFCDKCFSLPVNLIEHRLQHGEAARYQCKMCNEEFMNFIELKTHQETHVSDGIADYKIDFNLSMLFMCSFCEKCFKNYQAFNIHSRTHTGDKPYKCRFCSEIFASYVDSTNHRMTAHTAEKNAILTADCLKPFDCQYCRKAFTSGSALTKHVRIHTGEKPFPCRICNKSFAQSSGLYTHLKVHSNERPYQCDLCSRSFKIIGDYKQHVRRHSSLRSYVCDVCKKSFITQRSFSQHKKIHTNVRPYVCDICEQSFRRSHTLKIHKLRHSRTR